MPTPHYDWIAHHAAQRPGHRALIDLGNGRESSYAIMHDRVARVAGYLRGDLGILKGDRVAALAHNCGELLELMFACARLGAVYLPLNWRLTVPELSHVLQDAEPRVLVVDEACRPKGEALHSAGLISRLLQIDAQNAAGALASSAPVTRAETLTHDDVQMLMYTSGTTGFPKGALITYGMTFWNAVNVGIPALITPETRLLAVMPLFHTGGLNLFANPVFHAGGTVMLMRTFEPGAMLRVLMDPALGITHTFAVPTAYQAMADHPSFAGAAFPHLKIACVGGAATPASVLERWHSRGVRLANGYGMTETSPAVTLLSPEDAVRMSGSVGRPLLHTEIRIVDREHNDVPADEPGELLVRGPNVTPGYWRNDMATHSAFVDGWLKTGDIVRRDEQGYCFIVDRAKDMYISGGENVYPAEVESVLCGAPDVQEAAVISIPDPQWGESGLAVVVAKPGCVLEEARILAHCADRLARFKQPKRVVFVDALPRTGSGKVHKPSLRERFAGD